MSKIKLNWITGKRLLERWGIDIKELDICIKSGLPVYNPDFKIEEWGPIHTKLPNPDYNANDILSKKYIINKNNLHDFQVLLDTGRPFLHLGISKDRVLNNLLFKLEDVENYEKLYGKNNKERQRKRIRVCYL